MRRETVVAIAIGVGALAAAGYGAYRLGVDRGARLSAVAADDATVRPPASAESLHAGDIDPATGKRVLYWHDPMVRGPRFDRPGKSPFMDMMLVPVYEGDADGGVTVSAGVRQSLGVRIAEVVRSTLTPRIDTVGNVAFNERDRVVVQARAMGYVERLHVRATLDRVARGAPFAELYVPDWVAAQEEYLSVLRMAGTDLGLLVEGARQRMRQAGMTEEQIERVTASRSLEPRVTLTAPIDGVVTELGVREGMTVMPGETLFAIDGLDPVWVHAEVPEGHAALLRPGAAVGAQAPALPGLRFSGTVQAILPQVQPSTRTITARVELANPTGVLVPGMFVDIAIDAPGVEGLVVPTEAVIRTGRRSVVIVADDGGSFRPVDVQIGLEWDGQSEIRRGLEAGQRVVVSGQFLIDSEASLGESLDRLQGGDPVPSPAEAPVEHRGAGRVEALRDGAVTLSHAPIPSLQWGAMTMDFAVPEDLAIADLEPGREVRFAFVMGPDGRPVLTRIETAE